jgi:hypothetical protein
MFLRIWIFMLLINTGFAISSAIFGIDLCSADPNFACSKILNTASLGHFSTNATSGQPQINDTTSTAGIMTNLPTENGSLSFITTPFDYIAQFTQLVSYGTFIIINGFTGGYIFNVLGHIAVLPNNNAGFIILQAGFETVMIALFLVWLFYMISGRFASGGSL